MSMWIVNEIPVSNGSDFIIELDTNEYGQTTSLTFNTSSYHTTTVSIACIFQQVINKNTISQRQGFTLEILTGKQSIGKYLFYHWY